MRKMYVLCPDRHFEVIELENEKLWERLAGPLPDLLPVSTAGLLMAWGGRVCQFTLTLLDLEQDRAGRRVATLVHTDFLLYEELAVVVEAAGGPDLAHSLLLGEYQPEVEAPRIMRAVRHIGAHYPQPPPPLEEVDDQAPLKISFG